MEAVDKILPGSHPQLAELNDQIMIEYLAKLDQDHISQKAKATIDDQLPSGNVTDEIVARSLYMSSRKLQRQLKKAGTTFNTLLNEVRQDLAKKYLREEDTSMTEIAFLLGFSESSAFSRAFKRWTGVSPTTYRKAAWFFSKLSWRILAIQAVAPKRPADESNCVMHQLIQSISIYMNL